MKKTLILAFVLMLIVPFSLIAPASAKAEALSYEPIHVYDTDGESILSGSIMHNNTSYILATKLHEVLDVEIRWEPSTHSVTIIGDEDTVRWNSISDAMKVNGKDVTLTITPIIIKGRTYVPVMLLKKVFQLQANWDQSSKTVTIAV